MRSCRQIRPLLPAWAGETLPDEFQAQVDAHLRVCSTCRALGDSLREALTELADAPPDDAELTTSILAATTGSSCQSCRSRLCIWVEKNLDPGEGQLVDEHLRHCPSCRALAGVLQWLPGVLPTLRDVSTGESFTGEVLARTSRLVPSAADFATARAHSPVPQASSDPLSPRRQRKASIPPASRRMAGALERLGKRVRSWTARPLFPVEAAYAATLLAVLIFGPATMSSIPQHALSWLRGEGQGLQTAGTSLSARSQWGTGTVGHGPGSTAGRVRSARVKAYHVFESHAHDVWGTAKEVSQQLRALQTTVRTRGQRDIAPALARLGEGFARFWNKGSHEPKVHTPQEGEGQR